MYATFKIKPLISYQKLKNVFLDIRNIVQSFEVSISSKPSRSDKGQSLRS